MFKSFIIFMFFALSCANDSDFTSRSKSQKMEKKADSLDADSLGGVSEDALGESGGDALGDEGLSEADIDKILGETISGEGGFFKCEVRKTPTDQPIEALVYRLGEGTGSLPDLNAMSHVDQICMDNFNVPTRSFTEGFPGVRDLYEWFALRGRAKLIIPVAGEYTFYLNSDDGSKLYIDGGLVVDNDGLHPTQEKSATITLSKGVHMLDLWYYQGPATEIALQLFWSTPYDGEKKILPKSNMRYYK